VAERVAASEIPVQWSAVETGSGIRGYDLEVSADGGASWTRLPPARQTTSAIPPAGRVQLPEKGAVVLV